MQAVIELIAGAKHDPIIRIRPQYAASEINARHAGQTDVGNEYVEAIFF